MSRLAEWFDRGIRQLERQEQSRRDNALRAEQELRLLRAIIDSPMMHGGDPSDVVSMHLRKHQWALLLALVEQALK